MNELKLAFEFLGWIISGLLILYWAAYAVARGWYKGRPTQHNEHNIIFESAPKESV